MERSSLFIHTKRCLCCGDELMGLFEVGDNDVPQSLSLARKPQHAHSRRPTSAVCVCIVLLFFSFDIASLTFFSCLIILFV
jgi:hypothetical protein